ncbi:hypothetical protein GCM10010342_55240 [Streptomyces anulatus]|nr:hypothetical protein GCM10010342_55240 [Streptomyces anulatus]
MRGRLVETGDGQAEAGAFFGSTGSEEDIVSCGAPAVGQGAGDISGTEKSYTHGTDASQRGPGAYRAGDRGGAVLEA